MNNNYYVQIFSNHLNLITVFLLYDLEENLIYFGDTLIKDVSMSIYDQNLIGLNSAIPISKNTFTRFLNLSLTTLNKTNKNIFLAFNSLEEWII